LIHPNKKKHKDLTHHILTNKILCYNQHMQKIKTRFAPSPTGHLHLGGVRTALFTYLLAKHSGGDFYLRIEDTDRTRFVPEATALILDTLKWLNLNWDNKKIIYQTTRQPIYLEKALTLIEQGKAYPDPTPPETIAHYREAAKKSNTPFLYRDHRPPNPPDKWHPGTPIRLKSIPKPYQWHDQVMGDLSSSPASIDDIILIKADGLPTYNFAHIIDDEAMQITHITRGQEYLPSTPNYLALYEALHLTPPQFVTIPHILAPTGGKKLSKRDNAKSVIAYKDAGILKEAMLNFLATLGWNDGTTQEIFSLPELIQKFTTDHIQKSPARFDETRLIALNGSWIRRLPPPQLYQESTPFWPPTAAPFPSSYRQEVLAITYDRLKTLADLPTITPYFFADPTPDPKMLIDNKYLKSFSEKQLIHLLQTSTTALESTPWQESAIQSTLNTLLKTTATTPAQLFSLLRIAISYAPFTPALHLTMRVLTKSTTLARLSAAADSLS
jgi:glutamyl-tRNA synthetase